MIPSNEKEYDYAIEKEIPIMSFVIKDTGKLMNDKCEQTDEKRKKLEAFRSKVCAGKMVKFYTDCGTLQASAAISLNRCIQDFPAVGWVRGDSIETPVDIEAKIEKYMQEHTISKADIEAMFAGDTIIFDGGNAITHSAGNQIESPSDMSPLTGARIMLEELAQKVSGVAEWGKF